MYYLRRRDLDLGVTLYLETGFHQKLKTAAVFLNLASAYDTVWRDRLIYKMARTMPCRTIARLLQVMLSNRCFKVVLGVKTSDIHIINNGVPQGSVLALLFFNFATLEPVNLSLHWLSVVV
ncbi:Reverse transcriptase (RNA-dependent DNA polymerase) [Popillia japonica]|uniref:Reverse transcriptase (RNA-dependent DNA polymerase) n=1 Tax=Popillia japonica TaxID=7064 RepID=A0AAW1IVN7_POPJA